MAGWRGDTLLRPQHPAASTHAGAMWAWRCRQRAASQSLSLGKMIPIPGSASACRPHARHEPVGVTVELDPQTLSTAGQDP